MTRLDELLTSEEVAELLRIPRSTVSEYARRGVLPSIKLGRHRRFVRSDVADAIERLRLGQAPARSQTTQRARRWIGRGPLRRSPLKGSNRRVLADLCCLTAGVSARPRAPRLQRRRALAYL